MGASPHLPRQRGSLHTLIPLPSHTWYPAMLPGYRPPGLQNSSTGHTPILPKPSRPKESVRGTGKPGIGRRN